jgi:hypothetical protein
MARLRRAGGGGSARQAHGANLDLGHALIHDLTSVDPANIDVARFFVLRGRRHSANYADRLTMRISRCRTRGNATRLDAAPAKNAALALVAGRRTDPGAPRWTASTWARDCRRRRIWGAKVLA